MLFRKSDVVLRLQGLESTIKEICSVAGAPGLSLGVIESGETIHTANFGYRDAEKSLPPDANTTYGIASLSKSFVASSLGILVEQGKLSWATPVREILDELDSTNPQVTQLMTVKDLLIHNAGLAFSNHWWYGADGELLLGKEQTLPAFNALKQKTEFRTQYAYSNWPYCLAGEVIERLSGLSLGEFVRTHILKPLDMSKTSSTRDTSSKNVAKPYAVLDDRTLHLLPFPRVQDGTIMAAAQAFHSTVNDMLKFAGSLLLAQKVELDDDAQGLALNPLKNVAFQLSGHMPKGSSLLEQTYGLAIDRFQLPQAIIGVGCNSMLVKTMPVIDPGPRGGLVLMHHGSQAGYTTHLVMLPEYDVAFFVAVNSIGLGDPAGWVAQLLIETVLQSPSCHDYVALAREAAQSHKNKEIDNEAALQREKIVGTKPRSLEAYVGNYVGLKGLFKIEIRLHEDGHLQVAFQGRNSQLWNLKHYHLDIFTWLEPFNVQAKRAKFNFAGPQMFKIIFEADDDDQIRRLYWMHEPGLAKEDQSFVKESL